MTIPPTIGRKVWFRLNGTYPDSDRAICAIDPKQPMDATIIYVHDDRLVNLRVTDHKGNSHFFPVVTLRQEGGHISSGAYCEWMPFQVGQAALLASVTTTFNRPVQTRQDVTPLPFQSPPYHPPQVGPGHQFWPTSPITCGNAEQAK